MCNLLHPPTAQAANAAFKEVASQYRKALTDVAVAQAEGFAADQKHALYNFVTTFV